MQRSRLLFVLPALLLTACPLAKAATLFSQPVTSSLGALSDVDSNSQAADDFSPTASGIAQQVVWRGIYRSGNSPQAPLKFNLTIYSDSGGLPDTSNPLSSTPVIFASSASAVDTGLTDVGDHLYEFTAAIDSTAVTLGTKYWLSVLADTTDDTASHFFWGIDETSATSALRTLPAGAYGVNDGNAYFQILGTIPEPASLSAIACGTLILARRRRQS